MYVERRRVEELTYKMQYLDVLEKKVASKYNHISNIDISNSGNGGGCNHNLGYFGNMVIPIGVNVALTLQREQYHGMNANANKHAGSESDLLNRSRSETSPDNSEFSDTSDIDVEEVNLDGGYTMQPLDDGFHQHSELEEDEAEFANREMGELLSDDDSSMEEFEP